MTAAIRAIGKRTSEARDKFYKDILNEDSACFFEYTGVHGEPLCEGYDNFRKLVTYNELSNRSHSFRSSAPTAASFKSASSASRLRDRRTGTERNMDSRLMSAKQCRSSLRDRARTAAAAKAELYNKLKLEQEMEDEKRIEHEVFKAQNHRSLTFKSVTLN
jgi:hypothetical protein